MVTDVAYEAWLKEVMKNWKGPAEMAQLKKTDVSQWKQVNRQMRKFWEGEALTQRESDGYAEAKGTNDSVVDTKWWSQIMAKESADFDRVYAQRAAANWFWTGPYPFDQGLPYYNGKSGADPKGGIYHWKGGRPPK